MLTPICDDALAEAGLPHVTHARLDIGGRDEQEAFELAGERMRGAVFVAGGRSHGDRDVASIVRSDVREASASIAAVSSDRK